MEHPRLNIIFDNRQPDDYERLTNEFEVQGIADYKFWDAVVLKESVVESINASHKMIVKDAKERKLKEVVIAEQDLTFPANDGWDYFLRSKPNGFDIYVACSYVPPISNNILCGFHLYIVSEKFYDDFLSIPNNSHIDTAANDLKGDYKYCYPFAALQRPGFSANNPGSPVNYNSLLQPTDIYQ